MLIVLPSTTTTANWKECFDFSCPIKNVTFLFETDDHFDEVRSDIHLSYSNSSFDGIKFELEANKSDNLKMLMIQCDEYTSNVLFTCGAIPDYSNQPEINGTAIYLNGKVFCSWSIEISNSTFPFELIDPPQYYISESGYQIHYDLTQTVPVAAADYSQLPKNVKPFVDGYQYKAVGSEKYLLIARVAKKKTEFLLKVNGETPKLVEVNLKSDIGIGIVCNFEEQVFTMFTTYRGEKTKELFLGGGKIDGNECLWTISDSLKILSGPVKLKETTYELQIIENKRFVYFAENNFSTTPASASSSLQTASSLLIFMLFFVIFA
uniref:Uncharacterized protein n=1 Tax=Tetranychus urticae TaxID=32264 RepID=T1L5I0_TETUR